MVTRCPDCNLPQINEIDNEPTRFCEGCGYDFIKLESQPLREVTLTLGVPERAIDVLGEGRVIKELGEHFMEVGLDYLSMVVEDEMEEREDASLQG